VFQILWPNKTKRKKRQIVRTHFEIVYTKYSERARELRAAEIEASTVAKSGIIDSAC
jgi:hypothetical protein